MNKALLAVFIIEDNRYSEIEIGTAEKFISFVAPLRAKILYIIILFIEF